MITDGPNEMNEKGFYLSCLVVVVVVVSEMFYLFETDRSFRFVFITKHIQIVSCTYVNFLYITRVKMRHSYKYSIFINIIYNRSSHLSSSFPTLHQLIKYLLYNNTPSFALYY